MRQRYFHTSTSKLTFTLDVLAVLVSLFVALAIRSQLQYFLFTLPTGVAVFSLTLLFTMLTLFLFDAYSISFAVFTGSDMQRIMRINLIPSILLFLLRLASPTVILRMPYSMIIMEYVTSTVGFILIRTVMHNRLAKRSNSIGHVRRILLWAETADISRLIPDMGQFSRSQHVEVTGILNANPLFWQTEYEGLRVFGDETALRDLLFTDDRISTLCFLTPEELTRSRLASILRLMGELNLEPAVIRDGSLCRLSTQELIDVVECNETTGGAS